MKWVFHILAVICASNATYVPIGYEGKVGKNGNDCLCGNEEYCKKDISCKEEDKVYNGCNCCMECPVKLDYSCNETNKCEEGLHCHLPTSTCKENRFNFVGAKDSEAKCNLVKPWQVFSQHCNNSSLVKNVYSRCPVWECLDDRTLDKTFDLILTVSEISDSANNTKLQVIPKAAVRSSGERSNKKLATCSASCGWGLSNRKGTNRNIDQLCIRKRVVCNNRPCGSSLQPNDEILTYPRCKKTWTQPKAKLFIHQTCTKWQETPVTCISLRRIRQRFCRTCPGLTCLPSKTRTKTMKFRCVNRHTIKINVVLIKRCTCTYNLKLSQLPRDYFS